jgi:hypothetical protein
MTLAGVQRASRSAQDFGWPGYWICCQPPVHLSQADSSAQADSLRFMPGPLSASSAGLEGSLL